jgi:hypothetical protein
MTWISGSCDDDDPMPPCTEHAPGQPHEPGCPMFHGMISAFVQVIVEDYRQIHDPAGTPVAVTASDEGDVITIKVGIGPRATERMTVEHALTSGHGPWAN